MKLTVPRQTLDGEDLPSVRLYCKDGARLDGSAIQQDGASAAVRRVAADMGTCQTQGLANEVDQEESGLYLRLPVNSVDPYANQVLVDQVRPPLD